MNHDGNRSDAIESIEPPPRRRRWSFRITAILISLLPLVAAEAFLRFTGKVTPTKSAWVELHQLRPLFELNHSTQRWEIPPSRTDFFRPASFPVTKSPGTRRIFVLGGSTVQGRPWATETSFATWLQLRLQAAEPDRNYEVINCGGVSYASYRVDKILDEVLTHQPDAMVLYTGHNEFLEDRTYAETRTMNIANRIATSIAQHVRIVAWTTQRLRGADSIRRPTEMSSEVDAALDHTQSLAEYHRDPIWRRAVEQHFDETFRQMIAKCKAANVATIVCEPACDLVNTPPFKSDPPLGFETEDVPSLRAFIRENPECAGAYYRLGRILYAEGDLANATVALTKACDHDVCPLRATTPILHSVISACADNQIDLVRTIQLLDLRDNHGFKRPDGVADPELFVDHVHPTIAGHQRIAEAISRKFETLGWVHYDDEAETRYLESVNRHMSSLGEEYFARGKQRLEGLRRWAAGRAAASGFDP